MKSKLLLFAAALLAFPLLLAAQPQGLSVMSFNIRYGDAQDGTNAWRYRCPATILMIQDQTPDVIGLQEVLDYQRSFIADYADGYKIVGVGRDNGRKEGEQMCIMYNTKTVKLVKWDTFWLSETPSKPSLGWDAACRRTATWAIMKDKRSGERFVMLNTHLDHVGEQARREGMALILDKISEINPDGLPVVLVGDFNSSSDDPALAKAGLQLRNARETAFSTDRGATYNGWGKSSGVIDHIFYSGFSSCTVFEVVRKPYDDRTFISDHYPVKAILFF